MTSCHQFNVPYSQSPPEWNVTVANIPPPLTEDEQDSCESYLGGLWTLPADGILSFTFQEWQLRKRRSTTDIPMQLLLLATKFNQLRRSGGSFTVMDSGTGFDQSFTYGFLPHEEISVMSAEDAEEAILKIPPTQMIMYTEHGFHHNTSRGHSNWQRLMQVCSPTSMI